MTASHLAHRPLLQRIAQDAMRSRGLEPEFPAEALAQLAGIDDSPREAGDGIRDLRSLPWCSIDNDDSRDLDQLTVSEAPAAGMTVIRIAIADVDALVPRGTPLDEHARQNTTSVYTAAQIFPMLPERLSTDLTSLNEDEDRLAVVVEMSVDAGAEVRQSRIFRALVRNHAKLAYRSVGDWLEGSGPVPRAAAGASGIEAQLRTQDEVAQALRDRRHEQGALDFETIEAKAVFDGDMVVDLRAEKANRARQLIEEFMIAANRATASFLESKGLSALRRVVRSPERWGRIVDLAEDLGESLPSDPDSSALEAFLVKRRRADPIRFPDLSLAVVKLMGSGEYVVHVPGVEPTGHFGLAVRAYAHSTAPNRRYPDLVAQRLLKAAIEGRPSPYADAELADLAEHCTTQEDAAVKVERHVRKSAAALMMGSRVGERFEAIVTGASAKGTWVRVFQPPVEGMLVSGAGGLRVGKRLAVKLVGTDVEMGHVDFARA